jgi:tRNA(Ile)-lysidine synthase
LKIIAKRTAIVRGIFSKFNASLACLTVILAGSISAARTEGLLYHVSVHSLAQRVLSHIQRLELLKAGERVGVAVSGGIDSVALLRLLLELRHELGIVLSVVHFNHKLRGAESHADQEFVSGLAREHDLEFHTDGDDVALYAAEERVSVETAARDLRYGFFAHLLGEDGVASPQGLKPAALVAPDGTAEAVPFPSPTQTHFLNKIATGHTLDDQAETVLMRMIRGAGLRGLGGIHPRLLIEDESGEVSGEIVRPLLTVRRRELEQYLGELKQAWREDSSNGDEHFTRNRVRKLIVPLLEKEFNPAVAETLAELAEIARGEEDYWENEIAGWQGTTVHWSEPEWARAASGEQSLVQIGVPGTPSTRSSPVDEDLQSRIDAASWKVVNASVSRMWFLGEPAAVQRRLVKAVGEQAGFPLEFKHVEEILRFAAEDGPAGKELSLPVGWKAVREKEELVFLTPDLREHDLGDHGQPQDYEYDLSCPGGMDVSEAGMTIELRRIPVGADAGYNPDHLLDADSLPGPFRVRNWRPGDRFWPAHTKSPKKIKELLQEVLLPERKLWPVLVSGEEIVWLRGFPSPARLRAKPGREAIAIIENSLADAAAK